MITMRHWMIVFVLSIGVHVSGVMLFPANTSVKIERNAGDASIVVGSISNSVASMVSSTKEITPVKPVDAKAVTKVTSKVRPQVMPEVTQAKTVETKLAPPVKIKTALAKPMTPVRSIVSASVPPLEVARPPTPQASAVPKPVTKPVRAQKPKRVKPVKVKKPVQTKPKRKVKSQRNARTSIKGARRKRKSTRVARLSGARGRQVKRVGAAARSNYHGILSLRLRRYQRYPSAARRAGKQGFVRLRFSINASGAVTSSRIVRPSGIAVFDAEVRSLIRRVSPFPPIPAGMGRRMSVTIRLNFYMR